MLRRDKLLNHTNIKKGTRQTVLKNCSSNGCWLRLFSYIEL